MRLLVLTCSTNLPYRYHIYVCVDALFYTNLYADSPTAIFEIRSPSARCMDPAGRPRRRRAAFRRRAAPWSGLGVDVKVIQTPPCIFCIDNH
jgi:hypothetical protein